MKEEKPYKFPLRVYRTHDYDLMVLHHTQTMHIGHAAERAVIAYYKGEYFRFSSEPVQHPYYKIPIVSQFQLKFYESEAPGITQWLSEITDGYKTCFIKNILRSYIDGACMRLFREDDWLPEHRECTSEPLLPPVHAQKRGRKPKDCMPVSRAVSCKKSQKNNDIDMLLNTPIGKAVSQKRAVSTLPNIITKDKSIPPEKHTEITPEATFDAFSMFNQLRSGE